MRRDALTALLAVVVFTRRLRPRLPAGDHRHLPGRSSRARRTARKVERRRQGRRLEPDRPVLLRAGARQERQAGARRRRRRSAGARQALLPAAALADRLRARRHLLQQPRPQQRRRARRRCAKTSPPTCSSRSPIDRSLTKAERPGRRGHPVGLRRRPAHLRGQRADPGAPDRRRPPSAARRGRRPDLRPHRRPLPRPLRRARRQRPRAQHRPRQGSADRNDHRDRSARSLFDPEILRPALLESLRKLDPRVQVRNPVMFVVEIGAVITTVAWLIQVFGGGPLGGGHEPSWFTFSDHRLALAHGRLRQPRRGAGRGARPRPGGEPAGDADRDDRAACATAARSRPPSSSAATSSWSRRGRRSPATAP